MDFCTLALGCKAGYGPHLHLNARVELLVSHSPHTLDRGGNHLVPAQVEDRGWLQNPPSHICHLIFHYDSKFTNIQICIETCTSHQFADLLLLIDADLEVTLIMVEV